MRLILAAIAWFLAAPCVVAPQEVLWRREGRPIGHPLGSQELRFPIAFSDVNGDGWADVVCTTDDRPTGTHSILFLSGRDGSTIREFVDTNQFFFYRTLVRCGDVNRDGVEDYAVTREERGANPIDNFIEMRSGADDTIVWSVRGPATESFGRRLLGDLDLNGDGRRDLLAVHDFTPGAVEAFDHTGRSLFRFTMFAWRLGRIGDFDNDGCDDFLIGATDTARAEGAVWVYSGRTQQILMRGGGDVGNGTVLGIGDVDQDGVLDFAASNAGVFVVQAVVRVFSGRTGQAWLTWRAPANGFGQTLAACDFDQDGVLDLLMTAPDPTNSFGVIRAHSLRDGRNVGVLIPDQTNVSFAVDFVSGAPLPGHPFLAVVTHEPVSRSGWQVGRISLVRTAPASVRPLGVGCTALPASVPRIGFGVDTNGARIHVSDASPGVPCALLLGLSSISFSGTPLPWRLGALGFPGCTLQTSIEAFATTTTVGGGLDRGSAWCLVPRLPVPLCGQWAVLDTRSGQLSMSGGLRW